jgi:glycosyltransferase involved in cell wall biosynthesis
VCWIAGGVQRPQEQAYLDELRQSCRDHGIADRVRFLGARSDVPDLLTAADIHCQPNLGPEPFGIAFVEALYAGLPLLTTALGAPLEIVDGKCGLLTPPGDAEALAEGLRGLLQDGERRRRMGAESPRRAAELCDPAARLRDLWLALREASCG